MSKIRSMNLGSKIPRRCNKCNCPVAIEAGREYSRCKKHLAEQRTLVKGPRYAVEMTAAEQLVIAREKYRNAIKNALRELGETV